MSDRYRRFVLAAVPAAILSVAGFGKLLDPSVTEVHPVVSHLVAGRPAVLAIASAELALAALLLACSTRPFASVAGVLFFSASFGLQFATVIGNRGRPPACNCFGGQLRTMAPVLFAPMSVGLVALLGGAACVVLTLGRGPRRSLGAALAGAAFAWVISVSWAQSAVSSSRSAAEAAHLRAEAARQTAHQLSDCPALLRAQHRTRGTLEARVASGGRLLGYVLDARGKACTEFVRDISLLRDRYRFRDTAAVVLATADASSDDVAQIESALGDCYVLPTDEYRRMIEEIGIVSVPDLFVVSNGIVRSSAWTNLGREDRDPAGAALVGQHGSLAIETGSDGSTQALWRPYPISRLPSLELPPVRFTLAHGTFSGGEAQGPTRFGFGLIDFDYGATLDSALKALQRVEVGPRRDLLERSCWLHAEEVLRLISRQHVGSP